MKYWMIEPYSNNDFDYCVMPADTEEQHRKALEYAIERLEAAWDSLEVGEKATVTLELKDDNNEEIVQILRDFEEGI